MSKSIRSNQVVLASTVMLSFISFWRAAAIVLNDLGSTAYYVGGISEQAVGKSAPWFILGIMLFSYAVRAVYIESCSMFVRGGVYKVVHEAMGGTLAKFSVSALMFDYVLTGPISGVSAGLYLAGLINDAREYFHISDIAIPPAPFACSVCHRGHSLFLVEKYYRHPGVESQSTAHYAGDHSYGRYPSGLVSVDDCEGRISTGSFPTPEKHTFQQRSSGVVEKQQCAGNSCRCYFDWLGTFAAGHERRREHGPGLSRNRRRQN
jgi:hypothetical protein